MREVGQESWEKRREGHTGGMVGHEGTQERGMVQKKECLEWGRRKEVVQGKIEES